MQPILDTSLWIILLLVLVLPLLIVGALNLFMHKRGGVSAIWCGILILLFGGIAALLIILYKVSG